ncbi:MAG: hypothetical protein QG657_3219 [Acidobacteriota bacterium]|nr:hypothetical protein [Acidobacteriota bacterium]
MTQMEQREEIASIKREFERETISVGDLYQKFQKKDIDYKIYLVRENPYGQDEIFELVGILGTGRSCYVFLALIDKKLVSLRMSYEKADFKDKFDSVRVEMENSYDEYFLNILYPSIPVDYLCVGSVLKKNKLFFDHPVYTSFWEKAEATLNMKLAAKTESKIKWFREFLKGLRIIHARGRAHFDIKLGNLFLVENRLKIGDFEYYLKIDDFIRSKIYYCGTPGHIAPEMFYDKENVTERIDIFSAGVAFTRLFTCVEPTEESGGGFSMEGEAALSPEEEKEFSTLFEPYLHRLPFKKILDAFKNNFKLFNFYKNHLNKELENPELPAEIRKIYFLLLDMMNVNPAARPTADSVIQRLDDNLGTSEEELKSTGKNIETPVFKIRHAPIAVVNLNKKPEIEIGSIKQKQNPEDGSANDINLRFVDISRKHLQLAYTPDPEKIEIRDLNSKHGVFLNNERLEPGKPGVLSDGDMIQLGSLISFKFMKTEGFYVLKNVTHENKKGNLLWLDKNQLKELPDKQAVIILLKSSVSLAPFGAGEDAALFTAEDGNIEVKGHSLKMPVNGEVIL